MRVHFAPLEVFCSLGVWAVSLRSLRRYDVQATWAMGFGLASIVPVVGAATLILRNYRNELGAITYRSGTAYLPVLAACLAAGVLLAAVAIVLGFNSAGHRRNDKGGRSWLGFFVGGLCLTAVVVGAMAFLMLRL